MRTFDLEGRGRRRKLIQKSQDLGEGAVPYLQKAQEKGAEIPIGLVDSVQGRAESFKAEAEVLEESIRLKELKVYPHQKIKGCKTYTYWEAGWRGGDGKMKHVYLGSTKKVSEDEALKIAHQKKAQDLGMLG